MSASKKVPLFNLEISAEAKKNVAATLQSGWLTAGPNVKRFENEVASFLGMKHASAVNSCTMGLQIVFSALGVAGKEVITTPFTFVGTLSAILHAGGIPVLADIDPNTLNLDPDEVARKITKDTVAIVPVELAGYPSDYNRLKKIAEQSELPLISDSAHAIGAKYKSKSIPHHVDASVFSFYSTKNLTCGEGGMVVSKHEALIDTVKMLARHGLSKGTVDRKKAKEVSYDINHLGFKANMSEIHAAIGLGQLTQLEKFQEKRAKLAKRYIDNLSDLTDFLETPVEEKGYEHGWHLFIIRLHLSRLNINRDKFISMMADGGVECGLHYRPVFEFNLFHKLLELSPQHYPNTVYAGQRVVTLPLYPELTLPEVDYVCSVITDIVKKQGN